MECDGAGDRCGPDQPNVIVMAKIGIKSELNLGTAYVASVQELSGRAYAVEEWMGES
jgi:hypothetical protein